MSELSNTELIATRLLGWEPAICAEPNVVRFEYAPGSNIYFKNGAFDGGLRELWFDPANWNDIRRMEDAIFRMGPDACDKYLTNLKQERYGNAVISDFNSGLMMMCATALQRVAACVKVLREVQG